MSANEGEREDPIGAEEVLARCGSQMRARRAEQQDPLWAEFAAGKLDEAQLREAFAARAASDAGEAPDADSIEEGIALFAPLEGDRLDALESRLLGALGASEGSEDGEDSEPAAVIPLDAARSRRGWAFGSAMAILATAALALVWIRSTDPNLDGTEHTDSAGPEVASLPGYTLEHGSGAAQVRSDSEAGASATDLRYVSGDRFTWILRPNEDHERPPAWRAYARSSEPGATLQPLALDRLVERGGASLRVSGPIDALGLTPGAWTLIFVLAPAPELLPDTLTPSQVDALDEHATPSPERAWIALALELRLEPPP